MRETPQLRLELVERQDYQLTHAEVSAALLQKWELPQSLVALVFHHHATELVADRSETDRRFLRVMQIGESVANLADNCSPQRHQILDRLLADYGPKRTGLCRSALAEAVAKTAESSQLFAIPVPDDATFQRLLQRISSDTNTSGVQSATDESVAKGRESAAQLPSKAAPPSRDTSFAPVSEATLPDKPTEDVSSAPQNAEQSVLVIEDDSKIIALVTRILAPRGIEVVSCASLSAARALAPRAAAIFCDVHLGPESGIVITRELRNDGYTGPVIIISGDRTRGTVTESIGAGITDYLVKPFSATTLLQKLRKHTSLLPESALEAAGVP